MCVHDFNLFHDTAFKHTRSRNQIEFLSCKKGGTSSLSPSLTLSRTHCYTENSSSRFGHSQVQRRRVGAGAGVAAEQQQPFLLSYLSSCPCASAHTYTRLHMSISIRRALRIVRASKDDDDDDDAATHGHSCSPAENKETLPHITPSRECMRVCMCTRGRARQAVHRPFSLSRVTRKYTARCALHLDSPAAASAARANKIQFRLECARALNYTYAYSASG